MPGIFRTIPPNGVWRRQAGEKEKGWVARREDRRAFLTLLHLADGTA